MLFWHKNVFLALKKLTISWPDLLQLLLLLKYKVSSYSRKGSMQFDFSFDEWRY
jgi:hypothetical protein